jgi:hypothetical protein
MPRRISRETEEQKIAGGRAEMQEVLRETIGELTVGLAASGMADVLDSESMQPIVAAWQRALKPQPYPEAKSAPEQ